VEPEEEALFNELLPRLVGITVYHALNESKASEHSARMVAMKNASDKSLDMSKDLTASITKSARQPSPVSFLKLWAALRQWQRVNKSGKVQRYEQGKQSHSSSDRLQTLI